MPTPQRARINIEAFYQEDALSICSFYLLSVFLTDNYLEKNPWQQKRF